MKILIVTQLYPLPEQSGACIRTMNFVRFFQNHGTVDIAYNTGNYGISSDSPFRKEYLLHANERSSGKDRLRRLMRTIPWAVQELTSESEHFLLSLIQSENYDLVLARYISSTLPLFRLSPDFRKRIVVDYDDILSNVLYRHLPQNGSLYSRRRERLDKILLLSYERKCLNFGGALFCSESDRGNMAQSGVQNTFVVPNIYGSSRFENYNFGDGFFNKDLLFVGTLDYEPNIEGLLWFMDSIWVYFTKQFPSVKLMVVGRNPTGDLIKVCEHYPSIELHANARDLRPFYKRCRAAVVPVQRGGGTRIKIIEAAFADRPVLSTLTGASGLEIRTNHSYLPFWDCRSFTEQYVKLQGESVYRFLTENLGRQARLHYSDEAFRKAMDSFVEQIGISV